MFNDQNKEEPMPIHNENIFVWDVIMRDAQQMTMPGELTRLVIEDMHNRDEIASMKYETRLQPFNGRRGVNDALQELLDAAAYVKQVILEYEMQPDVASNYQAYNDLRDIYNELLHQIFMMRRIIYRVTGR